MKILEQQLFEEALNLLLYGLSTVFVFLCLLILLTSLMSKLVLNFTPIKPLDKKDSHLEQAVKEAAIKFHNKRG